MIWIQIRRVLAGALVAALAMLLPAGAGRATVQPEAFAEGPFSEKKLMEQVKVTEEQALALLRESGLPVPEGEGVFTNAFLEPWQTGPVWGINIDSPARGSLYAQVSAVTGHIQLFHHFGGVRPAPTGPQDRSAPPDEVRQKAESLLRSLVKDEVLLQSLRPKPAEQAAGLAAMGGSFGSGGWNDYVFVWERLQGGHPVLGSEVILRLDRSTLAVSAFMAMPSAVSAFGSNVPEITPDQALALWKESAVPRLLYQPDSKLANLTRGRTDPTYRLVYAFENTALPINAYTGKFQTWYNGQDLLPEAVPVPAGTVEPVQPPALPLTEADALTLAAGLLNVPQSELAAYQPADSGEISVSMPDAFVTFDLATGRLTHAQRERPEPMPGETSMGGFGRTVFVMTTGIDSQPIPAQQAARVREAALALVQRYMSPLRAQLRVAADSVGYTYSSDSPEPTAHIAFERYVNGIRAGHDGVFVEMDPTTLEWQSIIVQWADEAEFPSPKSVLTPDQARAIYFEGLRPSLAYMLFPTQNGAPEHAEPAAMEAILAYHLLSDYVSSGMVDAHTGAPVTWDGGVVSAQPALLTRLSGHWAEGELLFMLQRGQVDPVTLDPEAPLTRTEALLWLDQANLDALEPEAGEFRPDDHVTRAEFAVWIARGLQLGDLARSKVEVRHRFSDMAGLTPEQQNAATFLQEVGILSPGTAFRGTDALTQAEAAALVVRLYNRFLPR